MSTGHVGVRICVCAAMCCVPAGCTSSGTTCGSDWIALESLRPGEHSVAFRLLGEAGDADEYHASFEGSLTNRSMQDACAFAIYEFDAPPERGDIGPVIVGETPPDTIAGGGRLLSYGVLPAAGEHVFEVPLDQRLYDGFFVPEIDATIVIAFCSDPTVDIDIEVQLLTCADEEDRPPASDLMEQLW